MAMRKSKTRSEVRGGNKKLWKQKHTGRARMGTTKSPLWRGGGRTFAAKPRDFDQMLFANRKPRGGPQWIDMAEAHFFQKRRSHLGECFA